MPCIPNLEKMQQEWDNLGKVINENDAETILREECWKKPYIFGPEQCRLF